MSTWIKLYDSTPRHPTILGLSDSAFRSWFNALCYASEFTTDGFIPKTAASQVMRKPRDAAELVGAGRLIAEESGWWVVNYLEHQRSREQIERERAGARKRKARQRESDATTGNVTPMSRRDRAVTRGVSHPEVTAPELEGEGENNFRTSTDSFGGVS